MNYPKYILRNNEVAQLDHITENRAFYSFISEEYGSNEFVATPEEINSGYNNKNIIETAKLYNLHLTNKNINNDFWEELDNLSEKFVKDFIELGFMKNFKEKSFDDTDYLEISKDVSEFLIKELEEEYGMSYPFNPSDS